MKTFVMPALALLPWFAVARADAAPAPAITSYCTEIDLAGKSAVELKLLRNEVYARHGRVFRDRALRDIFSSTDWYHPDDTYSDSQLSVADRNCIALIKKLEAAAEKRQQKELAKSHLDGIVNIDQFGSLAPSHLAALAKNGFVVSPADHEQLFHVYEENDYLNVPSFITPDPVLQLFHLFFDMTLRQVETDKLNARLKKMLAALVAGSARIAHVAKQPAVRSAAEHNLAYLAVANELLKEKTASIPPQLKNAIAKEQSLIRAHQGWNKSPLLNVPIDYSQFIPRGHYTRTETLRRFFLAMVWIGQTPFFVDRSDLLTQLLVLCHVLRESGADKDWQAIYDVTAFYVGTADDLSPLDASAVVTSVFGVVTSADDYAEPSKLAQVTKELTKRFHPRIVQITPFGPMGPHVRLLGPRYILDSEILQRLSDPSFRHFPKGLDVMAVLGSKRARSILLERLKEGTAWPKYPGKLDALTTQFARLGDKEWQANLYTGWIWVLQGLAVEAPAAKVPAFMQTPAWFSKNLSTSLASWAELRHDTILYAKPSGVECGGEDDEPPPLPEGYVEPDVLFYARMLKLLELSQAGLQRHDALPKSLVGPFKELVELCTFLKGVSEKELAGTPLTRPEFEQIKIFGANLERLSLAFINPNAGYWDEIVSPTDKHMAVIADVHSSYGEALEEAVGPAYEILVVLPKRSGGRQLARGAVFSYFEFRHPMDDRLTDEKWQEMLRKSKAPAPPDWTDEFMVPVPVPPPSDKQTTYSSGC